MFSNVSSKALVHLPRPQSRPQDQALPRGECRFILPDIDADGARQRCSCVSFNLNENVPGSQCGCGHQAWHHIQEQPGNFVPVEEYLTLVDRFKKLEEAMRGLQDEMKKERKERDKVYNNLVQMLRGNYGNMAYLRYYVDEKLEIARLNYEDKIEGALDRATDAAGEVDKLKSRVADLDETSMRLEERIDSGRFPSRSLTPVVEDKPKAPSLPPIATLPIRSRSQENRLDSWDARVILIPKKTQRYAFKPESKAYARCQSRGLHQEMHLENKGSEAFIRAVEGGFAAILRGRQWMPLQCLSSSDMSLAQLPLDSRTPELWNYIFIESQCMANDKAQGDVIYIALMHEELGWPDIHSLPRVFGSDESCWEMDEELDRRAMNVRMDLKMVGSDMEVDRLKSLETDSMYEYSPPPYSTASRTHSEQHRTPTALEVLAGTASYFADRNPAPSVSDRSTFSDRSIESTIYEEDDEHRDKRTKHGALRPQQYPLGIPLGLQSPTSNQKKMYSSGRTKRKVNPEKTKEPMDWRVSEMKFANPMKNVFHRKHGDSSSKEDVSSDTSSQHQQEHLPPQTPV